MSKRSAKSRSHSKKASSGKIRTSRAFDPRQLKPLGALALGIVLISALLNALSLAPAAPDAAVPDVVISEVMTRNSTCLADDSGQYSDWIELCNTSAAPVSLRGWMLMSTSGKTGDAYVFADEVLDPGEY
ncbi:MAG: lamin tail domain-containing protein, partial [Clostridia bacterium]|nr:lamin tail domain-containing protein [Clostridia bacterium]